MRSARVAPESDRCGGGDAGWAAGNDGADAVEHEAGGQASGGEGVSRSVVVSCGDCPPAAEGQGDERELDLITVAQRVGRVVERTQAVDGALIGEQRPHRPAEGAARNHHRGDPAHRGATGVGGTELHLPRVCPDDVPQRSDLDRSGVEHLARAEGVDVLGLAVEGVLARMCHIDQCP